MNSYKIRISSIAVVLWVIAGFSTKLCAQSELIVKRYDDKNGCLHLRSPATDKNGITFGFSGDRSLNVIYLFDGKEFKEKAIPSTTFGDVLTTHGLSSYKNLSTVSQQGEIWFGLDNGVYKLENQTPVFKYNSENGLSGDTILAVEASDSGLYIATNLGIDFVDLRNNLGKVFSVEKFKQNLLDGPNSGTSDPKLVLHPIPNGGVFFGSCNRVSAEILIKRAEFRSGSLKKETIYKARASSRFRYRVSDHGLILFNKPTKGDNDYAISLLTWSGTIKSFDPGYERYYGENRNGELYLGIRSAEQQDSFHVFRGIPAQFVTDKGLFKYPEKIAETFYGDHLQLENSILNNSKTTLLFGPSNIVNANDFYNNLNLNGDFAFKDSKDGHCWAINWGARVMYEIKEAAHVQFVKEDEPSHGIFLLKVMNDSTAVIIPNSADNQSLWLYKNHEIVDKTFFSHIKGGVFNFEEKTPENETWFLTSNGELYQLLDDLTCVKKGDGIDEFSKGRKDTFYIIKDTILIQVDHNLNELKRTKCPVDVYDVDEILQMTNGTLVMHDYNEFVIIPVNEKSKTLTEFDTKLDLEAFYFDEQYCWFYLKDSTVCFDGNVFTKDSNEKGGLRRLYCEQSEYFYGIPDDAGKIKEIKWLREKEEQILKLPFELNYERCELFYEGGELFLLYDYIELYRYSEEYGTFYRTYNIGGKAETWYAALMGRKFSFFCFGDYLINIDIDKVPPAKSPLIVRSIKVDEKNRSLDSEISFASNQSIEVELFVSDSKFSDKVRYQYMLEGYTKKWSEFSANNIVYFNQLPPGTFKLKMRAKNEQGIVSDIVEKTIVVTPLWYQTKWMYTVYFLGLLLVIYIAIRINSVRLKKANEKLQKLVSERTIDLKNANEELNQTNEEISAQRDQIEAQKQVVEKSHKEVQSSINYAKRLQDAILPSFEEVNQHIANNFILFQPKDVVSGDFYWFEKVGNHLFVAAADCTGHGVPGAMVSVVCANALNRCVLEFGLTKPSEILDRTRELVVQTFAKRGEDVKDGMDISLVRIPFSVTKTEELNNETAVKLMWSGANNPIYIKRKSAEEIEIIKGDREPIGYAQEMTPFENHVISLVKGDLIYLFSDGYADQFGGPKEKKLGYKTFRKMLVEHSAKPMEIQKEILSKSFDEWIEQGTDEQIDDVCIIGVSL